MCEDDIDWFREAERLREIIVASKVVNRMIAKDNKRLEDEKEKLRDELQKLKNDGNETRK